MEAWHLVKAQLKVRIEELDISKNQTKQKVGFKSSHFHFLAHFCQGQAPTGDFFFEKKISAVKNGANFFWIFCQFWKKRTSRNLSGSTPKLKGVK